MLPRSSPRKPKAAEISGREPGAGGGGGSEGGNAAF